MASTTVGRDGIREPYHPGRKDLNDCRDCKDSEPVVAVLAVPWVLGQGESERSQDARHPVHGQSPAIGRDRHRRRARRVAHGGDPGAARAARAGARARGDGRRPAALVRGRRLRARRRRVPVAEPPPRARARRPPAATDFVASRIPRTACCASSSRAAAAAAALSVAGPPRGAGAARGGARRCSAPMRDRSRAAALWERLAALVRRPRSRRCATCRCATRCRASRADPGLAAAFRRNVMIFGSYDPERRLDGGMHRAAPARAPARRRGPSAPAPTRSAACARCPLALSARCRRRRWRAAHRLGGRPDRRRRRPRHRRRRAPGPASRSSSDSQRRCRGLQRRRSGSSSPCCRRAHFAADFVAEARACGVVGGVIAAAFAFDGLPRLRATGAPDDFPGWTRLLIGREAGFGGGMMWATLHSPHNAPAGHARPAGDAAQPAPRPRRRGPRRRDPRRLSRHARRDLPRRRRSACAWSRRGPRATAPST